MDQPNAFSALISRPNTTDVTLSRSNPQYAKELDLSKFKINGELYCRKSEVASAAKARNGNSRVWQYGEAIVRKADKAVFYYCYECEAANQKQRLPSLQGTSMARRHMDTIHKRDPVTGDKRVQSAGKQEVFEVVNRKHFDLFKTLLLNWFVWCQLALYMVQNYHFKALMTYTNAALGGLLPKSSKTLRD